MKKQIIITAIALSLNASVSAAEGFNPWNGRIAETNYSVPAERSHEGFHPWSEVCIEREATSLKARVEISEAGFRPWALSAS